MIGLSWVIEMMPVWLGGLDEVADVDLIETDATVDRRADTQ